MDAILWKKLSGAHLYRKNGSLIFCDGCDLIIGSLNESGYKNINLGFICRCNPDRLRRIEILRDKDHGNGRKGVLKKRNGKFECTECGMPLLSIAEERIMACVFDVRCRCGADYGSKNFQKNRLDETVERLKKERKEQKKQ